MTVTNVSLLTAKPCSNSCASLLRLFRLPRLIPRWPQPLSSIGLQALVAPFERIPVAPLLRRARQLRRGGGLPGPRDAALVQGAAAPQPAHAGDLGRMNRLAKRWIPPAHVKHPFPEVRFAART